MKKTKVAIIFNEPQPELYINPGLKDIKNLDFVTYFEVENITPMEEYELLAKRLRRAGFSAYTLNLKDDINLLLDNLTQKKPDVVFNFVEIFKENSRYEMNIVGLYELLRIPYTGAPAITLANCQNKILAKRLLKNAGLNTPEFRIFDSPPARLTHNLKFPVIVKPAFEDASVGIEDDSVVNDNAQLKKRIEYVHKYFGQPSLVEEFIDGRELNIAIVGDKEIEALPISEIDFSEMPAHLRKIVSYQAKWDPKHVAYHKTIPICPAILPKRTEQRAKEMAKKAFRLMGCRDYARVDIRLSKNNKLYILEVNPNPDLTEGAGFLRSAEAAGMKYVQAMKKIIELALARKARQKLK